MSFLSEILDRKRREVAERRRAESDRQLEERLARTTRHAPVRSLTAALSPGDGSVRVIAEIKRASPSAGSIDRALSPPELARRYAQAGAAAISVLTDGPGFGGSLDDLRAVREAVDLPLLRKDFVVDRYQLLEAKLAGADAALLIVAALDDATLAALHREAGALGLEALVEVHDEDELARALAMGSRLVGINNRNLKTFEVDLATSEALLPRLPEGVVGVAESGIRSPADVGRLRAAGASRFLIGEALVRAADPGALLRGLQEPPAP